MTMKKKDGQKKNMRMTMAYGAVGLIALMAIAVGIVNRGEKTPKIDLNATPTPGAVTGPGNTDQITVPPVQQKDEVTPKPQGGQDNVPDNTGNPPGKQNQEPQQIAQNDGTGNDGAGNDGMGKNDGPKTDIAQNDIPGNQENPDGQEEIPVLNPETVLAGLRFSRETGMLWPVTGNALVSFSPDHAIYNKTLDSYRTTDYVLLSGAVGTQVYAAAEGIVTSVLDELKTGTTVTIRVSEDHEIVYGLLSDVAVKVGDHVKEGTVFAKIAEPTRYFVEEGSGLYLKVLEKGTPVNPMLYLAD